MDVNVLVAQHELGSQVHKANIAGLSHEDSLVGPEGGGNCANWVVGHLVSSRNDALALLGAAPLYPPARFDRYRQGQPPLTETGEALSFDELNEKFVALQGPLVNALKNATEEVLTRPVPNSPTGNPHETVGSMATAIAFHEAYHLGQLGLLRRTLGKDRLLP